MAKRLRQKRSAPAAGSASAASANLTLFGFDLAPLAATWKSWLPKVLLIVAATLWIYWPALNGGFLWDDGWYITGNPLLHNADGLWKFWFEPGSWVEYYPLHETALWLQWQLFGHD